MASIMLKYQNMQTKYQDIEYKRQLKAMWISGKRLYMNSDGLRWIKINVNWPTTYPIKPY